MEAERSSLLLYDAQSGELVSKVAEGMSTREIRVQLGSGIAGATAKDRMTINIPEAYKDNRFNPSYDHASGFRTRSILSAPITSQNGALLGVVQVLNKINQDAFTTEDERFLEAICIHLGIALERAEMVAAYLQSADVQAIAATGPRDPNGADSQRISGLSPNPADRTSSVRLNRRKKWEAISTITSFSTTIASASSSATYRTKVFRRRCLWRW